MHNFFMPVQPFHSIFEWPRFFLKYFGWEWWHYFSKFQFWAAIFVIVFFSLLRLQITIRILAILSSDRSFFGFNSCCFIWFDRFCRFQHKLLVERADRMTQDKFHFAILWIFFELYLSGSSLLRVWLFWRLTVLRRQQ